MNTQAMHHDAIETNLESLDPQITEDNDPFFFEFGGYDEMQMRAENRMLKEHNLARQRHAAHVARHR